MKPQEPCTKPTDSSSPWNQEPRLFLPGSRSLCITSCRPCPRAILISSGALNQTTIKLPWSLICLWFWNNWGISDSWKRSKYARLDMLSEWSTQLLLKGTDACWIKAKSTSEGHPPKRSAGSSWTISDITEMIMLWVLPRSSWEKIWRQFLRNIDKISRRLRCSNSSDTLEVTWPGRTLRKWKTLPLSFSQPTEDGLWEGSTQSWEKGSLPYNHCIRWRNNKLFTVRWKLSCNVAKSWMRSIGLQPEMWEPVPRTAEEVCKRLPTEQWPQLTI